MEDGLRAVVTKSDEFGIIVVLILVLMEDGLRDRIFITRSHASDMVLILVLMEDGLRDKRLHRLQELVELS